MFALWCSRIFFWVPPFRPFFFHESMQSGADRECELGVLIYTKIVIMKTIWLIDTVIEYDGRWVRGRARQGEGDWLAAIVFAISSRRQTNNGQVTICALIFQNDKNVVFLFADSKCIDGNLETWQMAQSTNSAHVELCKEKTSQTFDILRWNQLRLESWKSLAKAFRVGKAQGYDEDGARKLLVSRITYSLSWFWWSAYCHYQITRKAKHLLAEPTETAQILVIYGIYWIHATHSASCLCVNSPVYEITFLRDRFILPHYLLTFHSHLGGREIRNQFSVRNIFLPPKC